MAKILLQDGSCIEVELNNVTDETHIEFVIKAKKDFNPKDGDFVFHNDRIMIVKNPPNSYHALIYLKMWRVLYDDCYGFPFSDSSFRYATDEEKQILLDELKKDGKYWDAKEKCIKDIPKKKQQKLKIGDKVRIKDGISSETHFNDSFVPKMDKFLGKVLTIKGYVADGIVNIIEDPNFFWFSEEWLEPISDYIDIGDWVIYFPNEDITLATVGILTDCVICDGKLEFLVDNEIFTQQIIKWDGTKKQLEKIRKNDTERN